MTASIQTKQNKYYIVLSWQNNGKRKQKWICTNLTTTGNNKRKVEQKRLEILKEWEKKIPPNYSDILFSDYMKQWLDMIKNNISPTTFYGYQQVVNYAIAPYFNQRQIKLIELKPYDIQGFYRYKMDVDGISGNTIHHYHANIHKALALAVKTELILSNPADKIDLPKKQKHIANFYTKDELNILLDKSKNHELETVIRLAAWFGLRRGEIIGMRWKSINFESKVISVSGTIKDRGGKGEKVGKLYFEATAKNSSSLRSFPLSDSMVEYLRQIKENQDKRKKTVLTYNHRWDDFVCVKNNGDLISLDAVSYHFPKLCKQCGLRPIKLHELRHSNISLLLESGASMKELQLWAGHSSYNTTADIYSHLQAKSKENLTNAIASALEIG